MTMEQYLPIKDKAMKTRTADNNKVEWFLQDILFQSPENYRIIESIRKIFNDSNSDLEEDIKYGGLVFKLEHTLMGGIFVYSKHISIEFSFGAELPDPDKLLEGKGKKRRHIKIHQIQDIKDKHVTYFVGNAVGK